MKILPGISQKLKKAINLTIPRKLNGKHLFVPILGGVKVGIGNEQWMSGALSFIMNYCDGRNFWDIGANLGQTLVKLKTLDSSWKYVGFEPNPSCVYYLDKLIESNNFDNCSVVPCGISTKDGILELELFGSDTDPLGSIVSGFRKSSSSTKRKLVPIFTFSSIGKVISYTPPSIIKIDAEGAELEVVHSLSKILSDYRPFVFIEILPVYDDNNSFRLRRQHEIEKLFKALDYQFLRINKNKSKFTALSEVSEIGVHSQIELSDYVVCPSELKKTVLK